MRYAILDTGAGRLQWLGNAESAEDAVRQYAGDVSLADETIDDLLVGEISDAQSAELSKWWDAGGGGDAFPAGVRLPRYSADDVRAALA